MRLLALDRVVWHAIPVLLFAPITFGLVLSWELAFHLKTIGDGKTNEVRLVYRWQLWSLCNSPTLELWHLTHARTGFFRRTGMSRLNAAAALALLSNELNGVDIVHGGQWWRVKNVRVWTQRAKSTGCRRDLKDRGRRKMKHAGEHATQGGEQSVIGASERAVIFDNLMYFCAKFRPFLSPQVLEVWQTLAEIFTCSADILWHYCGRVRIPV